MPWSWQMMWSVEFSINVFEFSNENHLEDYNQAVWVTELIMDTCDIPVGRTHVRHNLGE